MKYNPVDAALAAAWKSNQFVILDTETTGLRYPAEIVQICVLDFMGDRIVDTYVQPKHHIPAEATRIHGITNGMVEKAPTWPEVRSKVIEALEDKHLIIYNANYDIAMLQNSDRVWGINFDWIYLIKEFHCAMLWYADIAREWDDYHGNYRWQKLSTAVAQRGITVDNAHDAYGDCVMTHKLIQSVMVERAAAELIRSESDLSVCNHPVRDATMSGEIVCRDCGKTWSI